MSTASKTISILLVIVIGLCVWIASFALKKPEQVGILSDFDLKSGTYMLVFGIGEAALRSSYPNNPLVRVIDDQKLISEHQNEVNVTSGLTDFLPAEGRPYDIFLFVYRDGKRVGGSRVTQAERVTIPPELLKASRIVPMRDLVDNFDAGQYLGDTLSGQMTSGD